MFRNLKRVGFERNCVGEKHKNVVLSTELSKQIDHLRERK